MSAADTVAQLHLAVRDASAEAAAWSALLDAAHARHAEASQKVTELAELCRAVLDRCRWDPHAYRPAKDAVAAHVDAVAELTAWVGVIEQLTARLTDVGASLHARYLAGCRYRQETEAPKVM